MKLKSILIVFAFFFNWAQAQDSYQGMGQKALMDGDFKLAIVHLEKAIIVDSGNLSALYMLGYSFYHSSDYKRAVGVFSKLVLLNSSNNVAYYYRGKARNVMAAETAKLSNGDRERLFLSAIRDFSKAIEIDPDDSKLYQGRAFAYRDYGMFKGQKNQKSYDRKKAINAFQFCVADFYKLKEISPGRKDMMSHLQEATECLKELKP